MSWDHRTNYTRPLDLAEVPPTHIANSRWSIFEADIPLAHVIAWTLKVGSVFTIFATPVLLFWYWMFSNILDWQISTAIKEATSQFQSQWSALDQPGHNRSFPSSEPKPKR